LPKILADREGGIVKTNNRDLLTRGICVHPCQLTKHFRTNVIGWKEERLKGRKENNNMKEGLTMANRFSDFNSCKRIEDDSETRRNLNNFYKEQGFDFERVDFDKDYQSRQLQFKGVDVILFKAGASLYVDEKITTKEFKGEIFLELTNGAKQGWALNEKYLTDVLLLYYSNKIILIQYKALREYLKDNLYFLKAKYKVIKSDYGKENLIVPLEVLEREIYSTCAKAVRVFNTIEFKYYSLDDELLRELGLSMN
jgi:hypothetical protein